MKKYVACFLSLIVLLLGALLPATVYAQTDSVQANMVWDSSCDGTVNGSANNYDDVNNGDTINLQINNNSTQTLGVAVSGIGKTSLNPGASENFSLTLSSSIEVQAISTSCSGNNNVATL